MFSGEGGLRYDYRQFLNDELVSYPSDPIEEKTVGLDGTAIESLQYDLRFRPQYSNVKVVGFTNERNTYTNNWEASMRLAKLPYHLICTDSNFEGHHQVADSYLQFLRKERSNDDTIYILIDTHDALACPSRDPSVSIHEYIVKIWPTFKRPVAVGAEIFEANGNALRNYWRYNRRPRTNCYVNAGMVAGTYAGLLKMYEWIMKDYERSKRRGEKWCDQRAITRYIEDSPTLVALDAEYRLFANSIYEWSRNNVSKFKWCDGTLTYEDGQYDEHLITTPAFIHVPARFNDNLYRYESYGRLLLGAKYEACNSEYIRPGVISILVILIVILLLLTYFISGGARWLSLTLALILLFALVVICITIDPTK